MAMDDLEVLTIPLDEVRDWIERHLGVDIVPECTGFKSRSIYSKPAP